MDIEEIFLYLCYTSLITILGGTGSNSGSA